LLFGGQIQQPLHFLVPDLPSSQAVVSYLSPLPPVFEHEAVVLADPSGQMGQNGPPFVGPVSALSSREGNALSLHLGDQPGQVGGASPLDPIGGGSFPAVNGQEGRPLVVTMGSDSAPIGDRDNSSPFAGAGFGPASPETGPAMPPSSGEGVDWPIVPFQRYAEVEGTLTVERASITYQVSLDAMTGSVGFFVRPLNGMDPGDLPVVDGVTLLDQEGNTLDQVGPDFGPGQSPPQALSVLLHDAPAGGRLLVQISTASGALATQTGPTTLSSPSATGNVSFVLGVQRQEDGSAQQGAAPAQGQVAVGTLLFTSSGQSGLSSLSEVSTPSADATTGTGPDGQQLVAAASDSAASGLVPESLESFNVRVPTGPFASRVAGPLGPILATSEADLTPPVDRHERGLFQEIEGLGDDDAADLTERRSQLASERPSAGLGDQRSSRADPAEGRVVALTGGGRLPLKVTGLGSGQRADLPALLASLPAMSDSKCETASPEETNVPLAESRLAVAALSPPPDDRSDFPDYIKAACGLAFGLGLTTGPLFSDLLASVQARLPKWMRRRKGDKSN